MKRKTKRIVLNVTYQTAGNLEKLARMCNYNDLGRVVDKLVRAKMIALRVEKEDMYGHQN